MARAALAISAVVLAMAVAIIAMAGGASAQQHCDAGILLAACAAAINDGAAASGPCCSNMQDQLPCFCRNPAYSGYLHKTNFLKALASCSIPPPECEPMATSSVHH